MNTSHKDLKMFVLDVLKYDIEQIDSIVKLLNNEGCVGWRLFWPRDFTRDDILPVLHELVEDGMVKVLVEDEVVGGLVAVEAPKVLADAPGFWYSLTRKGRAAWDKWQPPRGPEDN